MRKSLLSLSLAAAVAATVPAAAWALTAQQAEQVMSGQQFAGVYDLQKKYGFWTAKATTAEGSRATVLVNDATGGLTAIRKGDVGTTLPSVDRVVQHLKASGFAYVSDVELSDGFWEAEVRTSLTSRDKVELVLHPTTLEVLSQVGRNGGTINGQPVLSADQILLTLQQAGYTRVRDLEFDDGYWEAEAVNSANQYVELRIEPTTGKVVREKLER